MRQAVFSSLGGRVVDARFLDLFAGSGAYGLEAVSRGAAAGVFIEKSSKAVACLRANIASVCKSLNRSASDLNVIQMDALVAPLAKNATPDLVFVDPPYEIIEEISPGLFVRLTELLAAKEDPVIIFEMPGEIELTPPGWVAVRRLGKGVRQPTVTFFRRG